MQPAAIACGYGFNPLIFFLNSASQLGETDFAPDEGKGHVEVYRIENFGLTPIEKEHQGMLFGGDSYVIQYTYEGNKNIIYYWLGKQSTQDDKTSAALQSVILDNKSGGSATIVRVEQGSEPQHFNSMFQGKYLHRKIIN